MIRKFAIIVITTLALSVNSYAGSDGELLLKKMILLMSKIVLKDSTEQLLRLIKGLDGLLFEPVAKLTEFYLHQ